MSGALQDVIGLRDFASTIQRGSTCSTIVELDTPNHNEDGLLGPNSIKWQRIWTLWYCLVSFKSS